MGALKQTAKNTLFSYLYIKVLFNPAPISLDLCWKKSQGRLIKTINLKKKKKKR